MLIPDCLFQVSDPAPLHHAPASGFINKQSDSPKVFSPSVPFHSSSMLMDSEWSWLKPKHPKHNMQTDLNAQIWHFSLLELFTRCGLSFPSCEGTGSSLGMSWSQMPASQKSQVPGGNHCLKWHPMPEEPLKLPGAESRQSLHKNHLCSPPPLGYSSHKPRSDHSLQCKTAQNSQSCTGSHNQFTPQSQI